MPPGRRLVVTAVDHELEMALVDAPGAGSAAELVPVAVPKRIGRYHPAASLFRERTDRHEISRKRVSRAVRIIHAIAIEGERRGWSVDASAKAENRYERTGWSGAKRGHLHISAGDQNFWLRLQEDGVQTRGSWEEQVKRYRNVSRDSDLRRDRELPSGPYDAHATGRLKLELLSTQYWIYRGRQSRWADRQSWTLEKRLPHLFREIEERLAEDERVAEEKRSRAATAAEVARREAKQRERHWQVLMAHAKARLVETHRARHLRAQADAWHEAKQLRRYCDALDDAYGDHPDIASWLAWARSYAAGRDPLSQPPTLPEPPEATPEALQDHLPEGWSAYGPGQGTPPEALRT